LISGKSKVSDTIDFPRQDGRIAVVTGANRGLGLEIATALARLGAQVVMACRDPQKAGDAVQRVRQAAPNAQAGFMALDLADLASIRRFAGEFGERQGRLDILVNNASAILVPRGETRDGFEMHMGVNHLGTFALTGLLLGRLRAAPAARIVNTSSISHKMAKRLPLDDLQYRGEPYVEMEAYGRSKWATLLFTFELDRRLKAAGLPITAVAAHPGWSNTNPDRGGLLMRAMNSLMAQPPAMGAGPALYAATMPDVRGGEYLGPGGMGELRGPPARVEARPEARDPALAARLWEASERMTGVRFLS
jgi:NAD(P)-dependent dehydrogenase (short-subunit alcohol dehydrogenase family)